jgi:hypothetical protein
MSLEDCKEAIKELVDSTDNELLLQHWKMQLEWDVQHQDEFSFSVEEFQLVGEGIQDYKKRKRSIVGRIYQQAEMISYYLF